MKPLAPAEPLARECISRRHEYSALLDAEPGLTQAALARRLAFTATYARASLARAMGTLGRLFAVFEEEFWADRRLRRQLREAAGSVLASLEENTVARVTGTVRPLENRVLTAPLSGRQCVYYAVQVTESSAVLYDQRRAIGWEQDAIPFVLDDGTAQAVIDPEHAQISVPLAYPSARKGASYADVERLGVLDRMRQFHRGWFKTKSLRFYEGVIEVDREIVVLGASMLESDHGATEPAMYRQGQPVRLRFGGTAKDPLVIRATRD